MYYTLCYRLIGCFHRLPITAGLTSWKPVPRNDKTRPMPGLYLLASNANASNDPLRYRQVASAARRRFET